MKSRITLLLLVITFPGFAQTAQEIINKHVQAIGGSEKLAALTSFQFKFYEGTRIVSFKSPDKLRIEFFEGGKIDQTSIYNGAQGWTDFGGGRVEDTPPWPNTFFHNYLPGLLVYAKSPDYKIEYQGKDEETGDYLIAVTPLLNNTSGYLYTFYIDPATNMIEKVREDTDIYAYMYYFKNYTDFNGVKMALTRVREEDYGPQQTNVITDVKVNLPLEDNLFEKPAGK